MADPFKSEQSGTQLVREAKIGLSVVLGVVVVVVWWSFHQYNKIHNRVPKHVRNAPIALHVGPDAYLEHLNQSPDSEDQHSASAIAVAHEPRKSSELTSAPPSVAPTAETVSYETVEDLPRQPERERSQPDEDDSSFTVDPRSSVLVSLTEKIDRLEKIAESLVESKTKVDDYRTLQQSVPISRSVNPINQHAARDISENLPGYEERKEPDTDTDKKLQTAGAINQFVPQRPRAAVPDEEEMQVQDIGENSQLAATELQRRAAPDNAFQTSIANAPSAQPQGGDLDLEVVELEENAPVLDRENQIVVRDDRTYQTRRGDSFWTIATLKYGDGRLFRALYEHNRPAVDGFEDLPLNTIVKTPSIDLLKLRYPELCPADLIEDDEKALTYTTREGDTLFDIARRSTGQASRYLEVLKLNRDRLPISVNHLTRLPRDIKLRLPKY